MTKLRKAWIFLVLVLINQEKKERDLAQSYDEIPYTTWA